MSWRPWVYRFSAVIATMSAPANERSRPRATTAYESRADRLPRPRPTSAPQASIFKRLLRRRSLARPWTLLRELDAVGEAHVYAQATGARATTAREHVCIITGRRPRADDARPQQYHTWPALQGAHHLSQRSVAASMDRSSASTERADHVYRLLRLAVGVWPRCRC